METEEMEVTVGRPGCQASTGQDSHLLPQTLVITGTAIDITVTKTGGGGWSSTQQTFHVMVWVARSPKSEWLCGRQT